MTRICYVIPTLDIGGTERQLVRLITGLGDGYEVTVVCTRKEGRLAQQLEHLGVTVHELGLMTAWDPRLHGMLKRIFRKHRPDIVHTFLFGFDLDANRAARETNVPVVVSSRRELAAWQKQRHVRRQQKANRYVDCIVANSHAGAKYAQEREHAEPELFRVVPNGVLVEEYLSMADPDQLRARDGLPEDRGVVCTVANFSEVKDYPLFLEMAGELLKRRDDVHFLMVGTGPLVGDVMKGVAAMKAADRFTQLSTVDGVADVLKIADVFVLCSTREGFPNAVMEAMAAGKPVVAGNVGGVPELVSDGDTGVIVETREPAHFADAVEWCLDNRDDAAAMGWRASEWVRRHLSVERMVSAYKGLYAELLAREARQVG